MEQNNPLKWTRSANICTVGENNIYFRARAELTAGGYGVIEKDNEIQLLESGFAAVSVREYKNGRKCCCCKRLREMIRRKWGEVTYLSVHRIDGGVALRTVEW